MNFSKAHQQAFWAYFTWGIFPLYWKLLKHVAPIEVLFHRLIWGAIFLGGLVFIYKKAKPATIFKMIFQNFFYLLLLSFLIIANWYVYVYAVNSGQILQGSLAYFITPIMNIVLGAYVFQESLSKGMKVAASIAGIGVLILIFLNATFPWIALTLATSFAFYGVIKKKVRLGGLESSFLESFIMILPAIALATAYRNNADNTFMNTDWVLLAGGGVITAVPLLLFSLSARVVPFNHLGILQFLAPTLQFLIGFVVYNEVVSGPKWVAFACVWLGVALYVREMRQQMQ